MTTRLAIKPPTPYEWWSNSLPPGQGKASNARGMPGRNVEASIWLVRKVPISWERRRPKARRQLKFPQKSNEIARLPSFPSRILPKWFWKFKFQSIIKLTHSESPYWNCPRNPWNISSPDSLQSCFTEHRSWGYRRLNQIREYGLDKASSLYI